MKKVDNFDAGKWLIENKVTTQSRLNEEVNDNFLYHNTSLENLLGIIKSNFILYPSDEYVSFSRYKNMPNQEYNPKLDAKIVIDKNKLRTKYKITPYVDPLDDEEEEDYSLYSKQSKWFQAEEIVKGPVDIKNYIKIIELPNEKQWYEETSKYITSFFPPNSYSTRLRRDNEPIPNKTKNMFKNVLVGLKKNNIPYKIR
jgi:hypothetical protein